MNIFLVKRISKFKNNYYYTFFLNYIKELCRYYFNNFDVFLDGGRTVMINIIFNITKLKLKYIFKIIFSSFQIIILKYFLFFLLIFF